MRLPYGPQASALWNPAHIATTLARRALRPSSPSPSPSLTTTTTNANPPAKLLPLDRALLHSPSLLKGWNALLGALRDDAALDRAAFELAACRVAALNGARFEWEQHRPLLEAAARARGDDARYIARLVEAVRDAAGGAFALAGAGAQEGQGPVRERDAAVLCVVDEMTLAPARGVREPVWSRMRAVVASEREVVELVASVAAYNMVSRFLTALDVAEAGVWRAADAGSGKVKARL